MDTQIVPLKVSAARFASAVRSLLRSEVGARALWMFAGLVALLCGISGLNVANSYVGRHFMTAIAERDKAGFLRQALLYLGVFAALTVVSVGVRFIEERIGLLWREFLTRRLVGLYLADRTFYRLAVSGDLPNPDQRLAEDVRAFTVTTLSFLVMMLNSGLTVVAFSGVLWAISPLLFGVAVLYAAAGSILAIILGRPLVRLNYDQSDKEASFRSALVHLREDAEAIMLARREGLELSRLHTRIDDMISNFRRITSVNRDVGLFTTGYGWLIQIIPALIVAPSFIRGEVDFGVITQSAVAFSFLVGAFSLIVTQLQQLSSFAAVVSRLTSLATAMERSKADAEVSLAAGGKDGSVSYDTLTVLDPAGVPLIKDLSLTIAPHARVLVTGGGNAGPALFGATAGASIAGTGRITISGPCDPLFLSQQPYLPPGTLRQLLTPLDDPQAITDDDIQDLLRELGIESVRDRVGGLDKEQGWAVLFSLRERQLLAITRVLLARPRLVFMDRIGTTLNAEELPKVLTMLRQRSIGYVAIEERLSPDDVDAVFECRNDGGWTWRDTRG